MHQRRAELQLQPGTKLGRYTIRSVLGRGGMAEVFAAEDDRDGSVCAIKVLHVPVGPLAERALREGQLQGQLDHPNIVALREIIDAFGAPALVMERVEGPSLDRVIGALSPEQGDALFRGILDGAAAAHEKGLVHRDLKPANILLDRTGPRPIPKIADFGLAKMLGEEDGDTRTGMAMGTPGYMPPEQIRNAKDVSAAADVFALGAIAYEIVSGGRRAFPQPGVIEQLEAAAARRYPALGGGIHRVQREAIERALSPSASDRFADAAAFRAAWTAIPAPETSWGALEVRARASEAGRSENENERPSGQAWEERRAVVVTDLVNSTDLVHKLGAQAAGEMWAAHDRMARDVMSQTQGIEIDKSDGFLVLFPTVDQAVAFGSVYHAGLGDLSEDLGEVLEARVGVHWGTVVLRENSAADVMRGAKRLEVEGSVKPTAARIMSVAGGAQTLLSSTAKDEADTATQMVSHGHWRLKGVPEPVELFEALWRSQPGTPIESAKVYRAVAGPLARQREALRNASRLRPVQGIAAVLVLAVAVAGLWQWDYNREKVRCYADVWRVHGELVGAGPLPCPAPTIHWRITEKAGQSLLISRRNETGAMMHLDARAPVPKAPMHHALGVAEQVYDAGGQVVEVRRIDPLTGDITNRDALERDGNLLRIRHLSAQGMPELRMVPEVYVEEHELGPDGLALFKRWYGITGTERTPSWGDGCFGWGLRYDDRSRNTAIDCLAIDDTVVADKKGEHTRIFAYEDPRHPFWVTRVRGLGADGKPTVDPRLGVVGVQIQSTFDERGRVLRFRASDHADTAVAALAGCAILETTWEESSYRQACLDAAEQPAVSAMGWSVVEHRMDETGHDIEVGAYGTDGEPTYTQDGWHRRIRSWNGPETAADGPFYGTDGQPVFGVLKERDPNVREQARLRFGQRITERDAHGFVSRILHLGLDGEPMLTALGWSEARYDNDATGERKRCYFGVDGEPVDSWEGNHCVLTDRTPHGAPTSYRYIDKTGAPVVKGDPGAARVEFEYNDNGQMVSAEYFDTEGRPSLGARNGAHREEWEYDEHGNMVLERYLDTQRQPMLGDFGWAVKHMLFEGGREVGWRGEGVNGEPALATRARFARVDWELDASGKKIAHTSTGVNGERVRGNNAGLRCWRYETDRNAVGNEIAIRCRGVEGELVAMHWGQLETLYDFDDRGRQVAMRLKSAEGSATPFSEERYQYDDAENRRTISWYDHRGQPTRHGRAPYASILEETDDFGNTTRRAWFDLDGAAVAIGQIGHILAGAPDDRVRYADMRMTYSNLGALEELLLMPAGTESGRVLRLHNDERGQPLEVRIEGPPILGISGWDIGYSPTGVETSRRWLNAAGELTAGPDGCARTEATLDAQGRVIEQRLLHADGRPKMTCGPLISARFVLDARGQQLEMCGFGLPPHVANCQRNVWDRGEVSETAWFTEDGAPAITEIGGFHRIVFKNDEATQMLRTETFGLEGQAAVNLLTGCATQIQIRNAYQQPVEERCLGLEGKPTLGAQGCDHILHRWEGKTPTPAESRCATDPMWRAPRPQTTQR